jgi:uncharacterized protein YaaN involved in tellurite resistance
MPDSSDAPLDLSLIDDRPPASAPLPTHVVGSSAPAVASTDTRLAVQPPLERLVEVANLSPEDLAAANASAAQIDFRKTATLLSHGDGVPVGNIAAAVIDGVKILRISDLQAASGDGAAKPRGLLGKLLGAVSDAQAAFKGFTENRKKFLELMDTEQAKARRVKSDLGVTIDLLDQQALAIRGSLHNLKIEIAAGQLAIDRGQDELENLRLNAVETGDPADAADVQEYRGAIANFRGKVAEMREALVGSAMLIPIIGQNKQAAETRMMKISNGMLVVIPRLMAVASQAVVQVEIRNAANEAEKLNEANRQITLLASKGAHEAATTAARSLGGDQRNIDVLAQVADETIKTMNEVIDIEREVAAGDREREAKLADVRNRLIKGMQGVNARSLESIPPA